MYIDMYIFKIQVKPFNNVPYNPFFKQGFNGGIFLTGGYLRNSYFFYPVLLFLSPIHLLKPKNQTTTSW